MKKFITVTTLAFSELFILFQKDKIRILKFTSLIIPIVLICDTCSHQNKLEIILDPSACTHLLTAIPAQKLVFHANITNSRIIKDSANECVCAGISTIIISPAEQVSHVLTSGDINSDKLESMCM